MPVIEREFIARFPHGRVERKRSAAEHLYAVARNDGTGRVTWHDSYPKAATAASRTSMLVKAEQVEVPWQVEREGRAWTIRPLTNAADLLMQDVRTPARFKTKREAASWVALSLASHLPLNA